MEILIAFLNYESLWLIYILFAIAATAVNLIFWKKSQTVIKKSKTGRLITLLNLIIVSLIINGIYNLLAVKPMVISTYPSHGSSLTNYNRPITIEFGSPVDFNKLKMNINPEAIGRWEMRRYPGLPFGRIVTYRPNQSFPPGQNVMLYLSNISRPFTKEFGKEYLLEFDIPPLPNIEEVQPGNGSESVPITSDIKFKLTEADTGNAKWDIKILPPQTFNILKTGRKELVVKFLERLQNGTAYTIEAYRAPIIFDTRSNTPLSVGEKILAARVKFTTVKPPLISSFKPEGNRVHPSEPLEIIFDQPMNRESAVANLKIIPETEGTFNWDNYGIKLTFRPKAWPKDSLVKAVIAKGTESESGNKLANDLEYTFRTIGKIQIEDTSPENNEHLVSADSSVRISFNQEVNRSSTEESFSIKPPVKGIFYWNENSLIFKPEQTLAYDTLYRVSLKKGIKSIFGLDSDADYEFSFKTAPEELKLNVPYFKQEESFTCNIAAARMILAYRGIYKTEIQLISEIGRNGTRGNGNPHLGYTSQYGTYWEPITKTVSKYRPSRLYENSSLEDIISEIIKGNPVLIWGQNGWSDPHELTWTNPDGTKIYAINGMHSYVVRGFQGPSRKPSAILVNDPWRGQISLSTNEFLQRWSYFKTALVVE